MKAPTFYTHGMRAYRLTDWTIHPETNSLSRGDSTKRLESRVMRVLVYFCENPNRVIGRDEPERLKIEITDNGVGFLPNEVEEPLIEEKLKASRKRGWGLKIIKGLMDEVQIESSGKGTTLSMSKSV